MQYETKILTTQYQKPDVYGALSMPEYIGSGTGLGGLLIDYGRFDWSRHPCHALAARTKCVGKKVAFTARVKTDEVKELTPKQVESNIEGALSRHRG